MAVTANPRTTYSDTTTHKRTVTDRISILKPTETPALSWLGLSDVGDGADGVSQHRIQNWPNKKYSWLEGDLPTLTDTLNESDFDDSETDMTVTTAGIWLPGQILLVESEKMRVESVSGTTLTVERGYGGTSGAAHATGTAIEIIGMARDEGDDADTGYTQTTSEVFNYTQIYWDEYKLSGSQEPLAQYGIESEEDYQINLKLKNLMILMNKQFYLGEILAGSSADLDRGSGGLDAFITTNVTALASARRMQQKDLEDLIQTVWSAGGAPTCVICNGFNRRLISSWYLNPVRTTRDETTGGIRIDTFVTEFGEFDVLLDRWCPTNKVYVVQKEYLGILPYRPFFVEPLAKTGDWQRWQIVGEYGWVVRNEKAHGVITGTLTS